jgi:hypothetical protein
MRRISNLGRLAIAAVSTLALFVVMSSSPAKVNALTASKVVTANFSATGTGSSLQVRDGETITYQVLSGLDPNVGKTVLERSYDGVNFSPIGISTTNNSHASTVSGTIIVQVPNRSYAWYRFRQDAYTSGASSTTLTESDNLLPLYNRVNNNSETIASLYDMGARNAGYVTAGTLGAPDGMLVVQSSATTATNPILSVLDTSAAAVFQVLYNGTGVFTGGARFAVKTIAQLQALAPVIGDSFLCSNCATAYNIVTATGTSAGNFITQGQSQFK